MTGTAAEAADERAAAPAAGQDSFPPLHLRRTARLFLTPAVWTLLACAVALNLANHLWVETYLRDHGYPLSVQLVVASIDFVALSLVAITSPFVSRMPLQALRLAGRSWKEIWRPLLLLLFGIYAADTVLEAAVQIAVAYEPPFIDWWYLCFILLWVLPGALFFAALLILLNAVRLSRPLQAVVLLFLSISASYALMSLGTAVEILVNRFWTSPLLQWVLAPFSGEEGAGPLHVPEWLLQLRLTELISGIVFGGCLMLLAVFTVRAGRRLAERRLIG